MDTKDVTRILHLQAKAGSGSAQLILWMRANTTKADKDASIQRWIDREKAKGAM